MRRILPTLIIVAMVCLAALPLMAAQWIFFYNNNGSQPTPTPTSTGTPAPGTIEDEFVGPFASWIYAATADGVSGGTSHSGINTGCGSANPNGAGGEATNNSVFQCFMNYMQGHAGSVIYLPAGTYNISAGLTWTTFATGSRVVGHSPVDTTISWTGGSGGNLLTIAGEFFGEFERIHFQGNNTLNAAWACGSQTFGEGIIWSDNVFENMNYAWFCTINAGANSEWQFYRNVFKNIHIAAQWADAGNLYDYWFWYNTFIDDQEGIHWGLAGGSAWYNLFIHPTVVGADDITEGPSQPAIMRGNVSVGANYFFQHSGAGSHLENVFQGNRILNTVQPNAIAADYEGAFLYLDNIILSRAGNTGPPISQANGFGAIMIGNQFTVPATNGSWLGNAAGNKVVEITNSATASDNDRQVSASSIDQTSCPVVIGAGPAGTLTYWDGTTGPQNLSTGHCFPVPPNMGRQCYSGGGTHSTCGPLTADETNPGANLQGDINQACTDSANGGGTRPVIHVPQGSYNIASTISIPSNCDVQIVGDGRFSGGNGGVSNFNWTGSGGQPIFLLHGHNKARFTEIGTSNAGIQVNSEDTAGSRLQLWSAYFDNNCSSPPTNTTQIYVNGLTNTLTNIMNGLMPSCSIDGPSTVQTVIGDTNPNSPAITANFQLDFNLGNGGGNNGPTTTLNLLSQGHLLIEGGYQDSGWNVLFNQTSANSGTLTDVGHVWVGNVPNQEICFVNLNGFSGTVTTGYINSAGGATDFCSGQVCTSNTSNTNALFAGWHFQDPNPTGPITSGPTVAAIQNAKGGAGACGGVTQLSDSSPTMSIAQTLLQFAQLRQTTPTPSVALSAGTTDVQFDRVQVWGASKGLDVEKNAN